MNILTVMSCICAFAVRPVRQEAPRRPARPRLDVPGTGAHPREAGPAARLAPAAAWHVDPASGRLECRWGRTVPPGVPRRRVRRRPALVHPLGFGMADRRAVAAPVGG